METIAIDIDDVLLPHFQDLITYYNRLYGTSLTLEDNNSQDPANWGTDSREEAIRRVQKFFDTDEFINSQPFSEAKEAVAELARSFKLIIITARYTVIEETTRNWLSRHFSEIFQEIHFTSMYSLDGKERTKADVCKEAKANWLVDDSYEHIIGASKVGVNGILFGDYPWNQHNDLPKNVTRAKDWDEVLDYFSLQT